MRNNTLIQRIGRGHAQLIILPTCAVGSTIQQTAGIRVASDQLDAVMVSAKRANADLLNGVDDTTGPDHVPSMDEIAEHPSQTQDHLST